MLIITFHTKLWDTHVSESNDLAASEGNVHSFGLLQPADNTVLITDNWLCGLYGFAKTDKAGILQLCFSQASNECFSGLMTSLTML